MKWHLTAAQCLLVVVASSLLPHPAAAQGNDPVEQSRVQFGPLGLTPSIALTNLGFDNNVFNASDEPKSDFTFTLSPQLDTWFRAGRSRMNLRTTAHMVYFRKYTTERSIDGTIGARIDIRTRRLMPWIGGSVDRARQRVGYEVDARSRREAREVEAGVDLTVTPKLHAVMTARRTRRSYDRDERFLGINLDEMLNREEEAAALELRRELTPLTTLVVAGEAQRDRFTFAPVRDADSNRVAAGFDLSPFALISGRVRVGVRDYRPLDRSVPSYRGVAASVGISSTLFGRLRVAADIERDLEYSFEPLRPYFVLTGATVEVTHRIATRWDVQVRAGRHVLDYQAISSLPSSPQPADHVDLLGGGIGLRVGREVRVSINADGSSRSSATAERDYRTLRTYMSVTYAR